METEENPKRKYIIGFRDNTQLTVVANDQEYVNLQNILLQSLQPPGYIKFGTLLFNTNQTLYIMQI